MLVFVGGASEGQPAVVTVGGVIIVPNAQESRRFFCGHAPDEAVRLWQRGHEQQVIGQAGILPAVVALRAWGEALVNRGVMVFIDNDSARYALIRGFSAVPESAQLGGEFWIAAAALSNYAWIARAPSAANVADAPSRVDRSLCNKGFLEDRPRRATAGQRAEERE